DAPPRRRGAGHHPPGPPRGRPRRRPPQRGRARPPRHGRARGAAPTHHPARRTRQGTVRDEVTYVVCREPDDLAYLANQGCITPHVWLSRTPDIHHPDQMVFDLDPASEDPAVLRAAGSALRGLAVA